MRTNQSVRIGKYIAAMLIASFTGSAIAEQYTRMNKVRRIWRPSVPDHAHTVNPSEAPAGSVNECDLFYIPSNSSPGARAPLYRLLGGIDDMLSGYSNEGGYSNLGAVGYSYISDAPGRMPIRRLWYPGTGDHMTPFQGEAPSGWVDEGQANRGFGYPRFGCDSWPTTNPSVISTVSVTRSNETISITANRSIGGAIDSIKWSSGDQASIEVINRHDIGRLAQVAFNLGVPSGQDPITNNPTEAGDTYQNGSPIITLAKTANSLTTVSHPLNWMPGPMAGGSASQPEMYTGTITKTVTMESAFPNAVTWDASITIPYSQTGMDFELAAIYLKSAFNKFFTFDVSTNFQQGGVLKQKNIVQSIPADQYGLCVGPETYGSTPASQHWKDYDPNAGGVIIAQGNGDDSAPAVGVYRRRGTTFPYIHNHFAMCSYLIGPGGSARAGEDATTKIVALHRNSGHPVSAGVTIAGRAYLVVGRFQAVRQQMLNLYAAGR